MTVSCGQVWTVSLDPTVANEQRGIRPCLVVSNERFNAMPISQALIVPLTSRHRGLPHHVAVDDDGGLDRPSWAMCEALRAVSTRRFGHCVGVASSGTVARVVDQLVRWLPGDAAMV